MTDSRQDKLKIVQRDGFRCLGCGQSSYLSVHEIQYRSAGGKCVPANQATLCMLKPDGKIPCHKKIEDPHFMLSVMEKHKDRWSKKTWNWIKKRCEYLEYKNERTNKM